MDELIRTVRELAVLYPAGFWQWVDNNKPGMRARLNRLEREINRGFGTQAFDGLVREWRDTLLAYFIQYNQEKQYAA